jgi:hypothetical protein
MATLWYQAIHAAKRFRLGTVKTDISGKKFIYLSGVASLATGDVVTYDEAYAPTRTGAGARGPVAVAASANTSTTNYSWFQVDGLGSVKSGTVLADKPCFVTATASQVDDAVVSGDKIDGMITQAADSGGFVSVHLKNPVLNGNG